MQPAISGELVSANEIEDTILIVGLLLSAYTHQMAASTCNSALEGQTQ